MGILVREESSDANTFFLKGADSIMVTKLSESSRIFVNEETEVLSRQGFRTLVFGQKSVSNEQVRQFMADFKEAELDMDNREESEQQVTLRLEEDLELLGVSGVEDLLQEDVKSCINHLREASIKVWMLTGDKLETAKCIGVCTGFKSEYQSFFEITSLKPEVIEDRLEDFDPTNHCLVITGSSLDIILNEQRLMDAFLSSAKSAKSVILCRCAPKQKAQVARAVKERYGKVVCCIGDGGNDVGMIQQANVGVGLQGKEGLQAALASDVSLVRFKDVEMLFLWHGRLSYLRTSKLSNFVIHRGLLVTVIQALFIIIYYYVSINIYNGYLVMGFNTVFTNLPVFALILDQDIPLRQALNYPILYDHVQNGKQMNLRIFLTWTWKSIFQGAMILVLSIVLLSNTFLEMVTITFTALIFIEFLNIMSMIRTWHRYITFSIIFSIVLYLVCLIFLRDFFLLSTLSPTDFLLICLLTIITWLPFQAYQTIQRTFFPSKIDIVINEAKMQDRRNRKKKSHIASPPEKLF